MKIDAAIATAAIHSVVACANHAISSLGLSEGERDRVRTEIRRVGDLAIERVVESGASARPCGCDPGAGWICQAHQR